MHSGQILWLRFKPDEVNNTGMLSFFCAIPFARIVLLNVRYRETGIIKIYLNSEFFTLHGELIISLILDLDSFVMELTTTASRFLHQSIDYKQDRQKLPK